jgi:hypothetical protein
MALFFMNLKISLLNSMPLSSQTIPAVLCLEKIKKLPVCLPYSYNILACFKEKPGFASEWQKSFFAIEAAFS